MSRQKVKKEGLIGEKWKKINSLSVKESQMVRSAGCCSLPKKVTALFLTCEETAFAKDRHTVGVLIADFGRQGGGQVQTRVNHIHLLGGFLRFTGGVNSSFGDFDG